MLEYLYSTISVDDKKLLLNIKFTLTIYISEIFLPTNTKDQD